MWLLVGALTFWLPEQRLPKTTVTPAWYERLGLDALTLLKNRDHRVVFITSALFCIPVAAFYPFAPPHLRDLGFKHTTAWMSLGQVTEIMAMFSLGALLLKWRLKWIFTVGLGFGVLRFALSALDSRTWLLAGVLLHGASFTFVLITAQIYLDQRVDSAWRARAQALLTFLNGGVGNLFGFLGTAWWFNRCAAPGRPDWQLFWTGLAIAVGLVMTYFLVTYRGKGPALHRDEPIMSATKSRS
jgi:hypothetical protein